MGKFSGYLLKSSVTWPILVLPLVASAMLTAACARFEPRPISAEDSAIQFEQRTLTELNFKQFLANNGVAPPTAWPQRLWGLEQLTLAALYFNPDLDVARAQLVGSQAAEITAAQRLNPLLAISRGTNTTSAGIRQASTS